MISYTPLISTLKKKKMDITKLQEMLGKNDDFLRRTLNEKRYISMKTLDDICKVLQCGVSDVVKYEEGEQSPMRIEKHVDVDWDSLISDLNLHGVSLTDESIRLGHSRGWLTNIRARGRLQKSVLKDICAKYSLEYDRLVLQ